MKYKHVVLKGNFGDEIYIEDPKIGGFTAFFKDFPEIASEGETIEEAQNNLWNTLYDVLKYLMKSDKKITN